MGQDFRYEFTWYCAMHFFLFNVLLRLYEEKASATNYFRLDWNLMSLRVISCFLSGLFHTIKYKLVHMQLSPKYTLSNTKSARALLCPINGDKLFRQSSGRNLVELKMTAKIIFWLPPHIFLLYFENIS